MPTGQAPRLKKQTIYLIEQRAFFIYFFLHSIFIFLRQTVVVFVFARCSLQSSLEKKKTTWRETDDFYVVLGHIFIIKLKKDYQEYLNSKNFKDIHILDHMDINISLLTFVLIAFKNHYKFNSYNIMLLKKIAVADIIIVIISIIFDTVVLLFFRRNCYILYFVGS